MAATATHAISAEDGVPVFAEDGNYWLAEDGSISLGPARHRFGAGRVVAGEAGRLSAGEPVREGGVIRAGRVARDSGGGFRAGDPRFD